MSDGVKRVLACALAALVLAGLGACGGDSKDGSDAARGPAAISGTITIWDEPYKSFPAYTTAVDQLDAEFEKLHPGVTIERVPAPKAGFDPVVQAAFTARKGPDILRSNPGSQGVLRWAKGLEVLNDRVTDEMRANLSGWDSVTPGFDGEGDIYGIPYGVIGEVFYYNKKLFKRAGLPTDFQPKTWEEVRDAGLKLKAAGIKPFTDGQKEGWANRMWLDAGWQTENTPEEAISLATGETAWTDASVAEAYAPGIMMQEAGLFEEDRFSTPLFPDGVARFGEGDVGMILGLWNYTASYSDYIPKLGEKNLGMFHPPGSKFISVNAAGVLSIPSFAKNKDAAWAYIDFFSRAEAARKLYRVGRILPNHKDVAIAPDAPRQERELLESAKQSETGLWAESIVPGAVLAAADTQINEVLQGRKSMADAQQALQDVAEQER